MSSGERYLTRAEAAQLLRMSERTVDRLADDGLLPRLRPRGRTVRFRASDVRAVLDRRGTTHGTP